MLVTKRDDAAGDESKVFPLKHFNELFSSDMLLKQQLSWNTVQHRLSKLTPNDVKLAHVV